MERNYLILAAKGYLANYAGLPTACWSRIVARCISATAGSVSFFLSLYFVSILHISLVTTGIIIACYGIGTTIGGIISGKLADRISPRIVSISGLLLQSTAFLFFLKITNPYLLMANEFLSGMAAYSFITANSLLVLNQAKQSETEKRKTIHVMYTASNLGIGLGATIVAIFATYGFHYLFLCSSILLFLTAFYLMLWEKPSELINTDINSTLATTDKIQQPTDRKVLWLILSCVFLNGLTLAQLSSTFSIYLAAQFPQLGASAASYMFILNTVLIVFLQTPIGGIFKDSNKFIMAGVGALLVGLGMMLLSFAWVFSIAIIAGFIYTIGEMLFIPMAQLICYQNGAAKKKGQSIGMYQTTYALSVVIGPIIGTHIYHHFGGHVVWYGSGLLGIVCFMLCFLYVKKTTTKLFV
jgi:predicted MFS family arabinose efflux permease